MTEPRAVVIPFGVPSEGQGLGLGLAAMVHAFARVEGSGVALAQLQPARTEGGGTAADGRSVETFVLPATWRDLASRVDARGQVELVLTGIFEPPVEGRGAIELVAFDARDGQTRARAAVPIDPAQAGAGLVAAFEQVLSHLPGELGGLQGLRDLGWEPLESVLRAERCFVPDPARRAPPDRLAAMLHLGRAVADAPGSPYPAARLVAVAVDVAAERPIDRKLASSAARMLERAITDAPERVELLEALGTLLLRLEQPREAARRLRQALASAPGRPRTCALLAEALRAQRDLDGAIAALDAGLAETRGDPLLWAEKGTLLAERGDLAGAEAAWREALARDAVHPVAFVSLAAVAVRAGDGVTAQSLIDAALAAARVHVDVLRRAVRLALETEADGLARASRLARLCERVVAAAPDDAQAALLLARSLVSLGERREARARFARIEGRFTGSSAAAEAQVSRLALDDPRADQEIQSALRAAQSADPGALEDVAARARRLGTAHGAWMGWLAAAVAERRRGRPQAARAAIEAGLELAPGAARLHDELAALRERPRAGGWAERLRRLFEFSDT